MIAIIVATVGMIIPGPAGDKGPQGPIGLQGPVGLPGISTGTITGIIVDIETNELQRKALWNYWVIRNDGSKGIHNTQFSVQVLQETYK